MKKSTIRFYSAENAVFPQIKVFSVLVYFIIIDQVAKKIIQGHFGGYKKRTHPYFLNFAFDLSLLTTARMIIKWQLRICFNDVVQV